MKNNFVEHNALFMYSCAAVKKRRFKLCSYAEKKNNMSDKPPVYTGKNIFLKLLSILID